MTNRALSLALLALLILGTVLIFLMGWDKIEVVVSIRVLYPLAWLALCFGVELFLMDRKNVNERQQHD